MKIWNAIAVAAVVAAILVILGAPTYRPAALLPAAEGVFVLMKAKGEANRWRLERRGDRGEVAWTTEIEASPLVHRFQHGLSLSPTHIWVRQLTDDVEQRVTAVSLSSGGVAGSWSICSGEGAYTALRLQHVVGNRLLAFCGIGKSSTAVVVDPAHGPKGTPLSLGAEPDDVISLNAHTAVIKLMDLGEWWVVDVRSKSVVRKLKTIGDVCSHKGSLYWLNYQGALRAFPSRAQEAPPVAPRRIWHTCGTRGDALIFTTLRFPSEGHEMVGVSLAGKLEWSWELGGGVLTAHAGMQLRSEINASHPLRGVLGRRVVLIRKDRHTSKTGQIGILDLTSRRLSWSSSEKRWSRANITMQGDTAVITTGGDVLAISTSSEPPLVTTLASQSTATVRPPYVGQRRTWAMTSDGVGGWFAGNLKPFGVVPAMGEQPPVSVHPPSSPLPIRSGR